MTVLPEVSFVETDTEKVKTSVVQAYESLTNRKLADADPVKLFLLSLASVIVQQRILINESAKQNLLYYSKDKVLDHKGSEWGTPRIESTAATTIFRFKMSVVQDAARIISKGTLVTADGEIFFETTEDAIVEAGTDSVTIDARCTATGEVGNGYTPGTINVLVKPIPFVQFVQNTTISDGGTEAEEDEPYRERVHQAPERLSVAGPEGAYEYWAKTASSLISNVYVDSPSPGEVDVKVLLKDGRLPTEEIIDSVSNILGDKKIRPLTDYVSVSAPTVVNYDLNVSYFIDENAVNLTLIQNRVEKAVADYVVWQSSKIGRDINPSKLYADCISAGAKRIIIESPAFTKVNKGEVAQVANLNLIFGGVEDD